MNQVKVGSTFSHQVTLSIQQHPLSPKIIIVNHSEDQ